MKFNSPNVLRRVDNKRKAGGFSLVELLVVLAVIGIISVVIIARYRDYDSATLLRSLAYDIALSVREAQVLGVGVRGDGGGFDAPYGVHFDLNTPTQYVLFRDADDGEDYDPSEAVSTFTIGNGNYIGDICVDGDCDTYESISVLFRRPDLDAVFASNGTPLSAGSVTVTASSGENNQTIRIGSTGQISVNSSN